MSERDFLSATPRMLLAALDEKAKIQRLENMRAGTIAAMVANGNGAKPGGGAWSWQDFFGEEEPGPDESVLKEKIRAVFQSLKRGKK